MSPVSSKAIALLALLASACFPAAAAAFVVNVSGTQTPRTVRPGEANVVVFELAVTNNSAFADTLRAITFTNQTTGAGSQVERDLELGTARVRLDDGDGVFEPADPVVGTASASGGRIRFTGLHAAIPALGSARFYLVCDVSVLARDSDHLDASIEATSDLTFAMALSIGGTFPIRPAGDFPVDGMSAAQIGLHALPAGVLPAGAAHQLVLDVTVPANGYEADVLQRVEVVNLGTAVAGTDIDALQLHADDGDGLFEPATDPVLGVLTPIGGGHWVLTGLSKSVPIGGVRLFVGADLDLFATDGRTVRLSLPTTPDLGLAMASANDGPVDQAVAQPNDLTLSTANRVNLSAAPLPSGSRRPGSTGATLLQLVADNRYASPRTVTHLRVTDLTQGTGSQAELDREIERVALRLDGNGDGVLGTLAQDPEVASAPFSSGHAELGGFTWTIPNGTTRHAFVVADLSTAYAADADSVAADLASALDVTFAESTLVAARWPLDSGARFAVDGMVAAQIVLGNPPSATLGPGEGPALALEVVAPPNGYRADVLQRLRVVNLGTASPSDLAQVRLWRDGGDHVFQAGGDDVDLGPLTWNGSAWESGPLSASVATTGTRLWISAVIGGTPVDSVTIRFGVPVGGLDMASGNDGPLDQAVPGSTTLLVSNAPLLATLEIEPSESVVGQTVTARMVVRNRSTETVNGITPSALAVSGSGALTPQTGPLPSSFNLAPAASDTFTWTLAAAAAGSVQLSGRATGTGAVSGSPASSLTALSPVRVIDVPATAIDVQLTQSMPSTVARGQAGIVPLTLTFTHPGAAGTAPIRIQRVILRLEDADGIGRAPDSLLSRVALEQGGTVMVARDTLETAGATVDLPLATPLVVPAGGSAALHLKIDVADSTVVPNFRIAVVDSGAFAACENPTSRPLPVRLQGASYPFRTALARVVASATALDLAAIAAPDSRAGRGQTNVPLMALSFDDPGLDGLTSDVRLLAFAVGAADTSDVTLPRLSDVFTQIRVIDGPRTLATRTIYPTDDSTVTLALSPALNLHVNTPAPLAIVGDLRPDAPTTRLRLHLADSLTVDARDVNSGDGVPARPAAWPLRGPRVRIEAVAESLRAQGTPEFGPRTRIGESGVPALAATLRHPGSADVGRIRVDSLVILSRDDQHHDLAPATVLARVLVRWQGLEVANVVNLPASGGRTAIPLTGAMMEAGDTARIDVVVDVAANAPESALELSIPGTGLVAFDANLGTPVLVLAEDGSELPLVSGLTRLEPPARELRADLVNQMPVALAADGRDVVAGRLRVRNPSASGGDTIFVDHLLLRAATKSGAALALGAGATSVEAWENGAPWAASGTLASDSVTATLAATTPLAVPPATSIELDLRFRTVTSNPPPDLRIGLDSAGVGVRQPTSALLRIEVRPEAGRTLPQWTEAGVFGARSLAASVSNFPNPFAAGREATHFVYYLRADARVTVRVATLAGDWVRTPLERAPRAMGMHEEDAWDGLNGVGRVVRNGVYLAELVVEFDDGGRERVVRKVAVVR